MGSLGPMIALSARVVDVSVRPDGSAVLHMHGEGPGLLRVAGRVPAGFDSCKGVWLRSRQEGKSHVVYCRRGSGGEKRWAVRVAFDRIVLVSP